MQTGLDKLKNAFGEALPLPPGVNYEEIEYGKTEGWDSVAHMTLVAQIEGTFDVMLDTDEVVGLSSFVKARSVLNKHGVSLE
jgi:acyl carrier protein